MLAITTVQMAAQDANVGASLARRLNADELDTEADAVAEFLHRSATWLTDPGERRRSSNDRTMDLR